jgi:multiple antibiotic resistance protein
VAGNDAGNGIAAVNDFVNTFLLVYAGLFPIVNPVGGAPIFLGLTRHCSEEERHALSGRVAVNGFFLLLGSLFVGSHVLEFFGITLPVVRIAGGLVVTAFGWKLLQAGEEPDDRRAADTAGRPVAPTDAFYPLTMPLTVGPGSISVAITLGSQRPKEATDLAHLALLGGAAVAGLIAIAATIFICYRFAERIVAALGENGTNVLVRLSAFILLCIGIEIIWNGYSALAGIANQ